MIGLMLSVVSGLRFRFGLLFWNRFNFQFGLWFLDTMRFLCALELEH